MAEMNRVIRPKKSRGFDGKLIITVTDTNGSRQYNIKKYFKQIVIYGGLITIVAILFSVIAIRLLLSEVREIESRRDLMQKEYTQINEKNEYLQALIDEKTEELVKVSDKIEDLEGIIGVGNISSEKNNLSLAERVDLASITGAQKTIVHRLIPNGSPIKDSYRITDGWGVRMHPILRRTHNHTGMDFGVPTGTPVYATADGVADFASDGYNSGYGVMLKLEHSFGFKTFYAHLSKIAVQKGEFVRRGQLIAYSGNSGRSTGPHLHYEIRYLGKDLNPYTFVKWNMRDYDQIFEKEKNVKWQSLLTMINQLLEIRETQALSLREQ